MPSHTPILSIDEVRERVADHCFAPTRGTAFGVEVEFLTLPTDPGAPRADVEELRALLGTGLPNGSVITFEPGGQVEVSSAPGADVATVCTSTAEDLDHLRARMAGAGLRAVGLGFDPTRPPQRVNDHPRYAAMETYFDANSPGGRTMMTNTAAVHANVQVDGCASRRWHLAHRIGPVLLAAFANSPLGLSGPTGWRSSRAHAWSRIDRGRSAPADDGTEGPAAWTNYALRANVMLIRTPAAYVPVTVPLTFQRWVVEGHDLGYPTVDDLDYHLTTLFPPVRPRGWIEMRMIDALPDPWWRVACAVASSLLADDEAARRADAATAATAGCWTEAARHGLSHPGLASAALACFHAALEALGRLGADGTTTAAAEEYLDRYVSRGRTPADERLDAWHARGALLPDDDVLEVA